MVCEAAPRVQICYAGRHHIFHSALWGQLITRFCLWLSSEFEPGHQITTSVASTLNPMLFNVPTALSDRGVGPSELSVGDQRPAWPAPEPQPMPMISDFFLLVLDAIYYT